MTLRNLFAVVAVAGALLSARADSRAQPASAASPGTRTAQAWPREVKGPTVTVVMYEPQLERVTENEVEARAAMQVIRTGTTPAFGAVWISARVDIDRDARVVSFRDIRIPRVRFVDASEDDKTALTNLLEQQMPTWNLDMALDEVIPLLNVAEHENPLDAGLKHDPPQIIVATVPSTLVVLDGPERRQPMTTPPDAARDKLERVVNTPALIVFHPARKLYYLAGGGDLWYSAAQISGPYSAVPSVPATIAALAPKPDASDTSPPGKAPDVIVAIEPTELIVLAGKPHYVPIGDASLLAVSNADADIIVPLGTNAPHYVLLSGRWYVSPNELKGPWSFVESRALPPAFAKIPTDSMYGHVRAHVPGTVEAQEALLDNIVPETQAIRRDDVSFKATYDGAPSFKDVEGISTLQYAANTPQSVFKLRDRYYACEQGVWYESSSAAGPWLVSTSVPKEIYSIPASNPHHNVTYVKVYDVTPQVVYVGYTPGYLGSYPHGGCIVYGTGWYYPGWYGTVYYPRSATWGFRATYHPYVGWGFGIGWSSGPLTVSIGLGGPTWGYPSYWGPWGYRPVYPMYRPPYYPGYRPPYYPGYRPPGYPGYRPPVNGGGRPGTPAQLPAGGRGARPSDGSLYRRAENAGRNRPANPAADRARPTPTARPNNVFSSPSGDVYRRNPSGQWDQRQGGNWRPNPEAGGGSSRPASPPARPSPGAGTNRPSAPSTRPVNPPGGLNQDYAARQRGATRSGAAPRQPAPRGGGGSRR